MNWLQKVRRTGFGTGGTVVIDEHVVPIVGVVLEDGLIHFIAHIDPCPWDLVMRDGQEFRIHGSDGTEIAGCRWTVNGGKPLAVTAGARLTVNFPIHFERMTGGGERR